MKNDKKHISKKDFRRYLADEMNNDERNQFERLLQKHTFEAEAFEGMANFNINEISSDITELENKLSQKKKKTNFRYWAAAASILLIISSGIIIIQLNNKSPIPEIAENKIETQKENDNLTDKNTQKPNLIKEESQITDKENENEAVDVQNEFIPKQTVNSTSEDENVEADENISKNELNDNFSEKLTKQISNEKKARSESVKLQTPVSRQITEQNLFDEIDTPMAEFEISQTFEDSSSEFITGKVVSAYDGNLLSQVSISTENSEFITTTDQNGNFKFEKPDSNQTFIFNLTGMEQSEYNYPDDTENIIKMHPLISNEPLASRLSNMMQKEIIKNREAQPLGGFEEFNKYLEESSIIPEGYTAKSKRVQLKIKIDSTGKITDIKASNSPDSLLFLKAKEIILARPVWLPEIKDGEPMETEIKLKLKFIP